MYTSPFKADLTSFGYAGVSWQEFTPGQEIGHINCKANSINLFRNSRMF